MLSKLLREVVEKDSKTSLWKQKANDIKKKYYPKRQKSESFIRLDPNKSYSIHLDLKDKERFKKFLDMNNIPKRYIGEDLWIDVIINDKKTAENLWIDAMINDKKTVESIIIYIVDNKLAGWDYEYSKSIKGEELYFSEMNYDTSEMNYDVSNKKYNINNLEPLLGILIKQKDIHTAMKVLEDNGYTLPDTQSLLTAHDDIILYRNTQSDPKTITGWDNRNSVEDDHDYKRSLKFDYNDIIRFEEIHYEPVKSRRTPQHVSVIREGLGGFAVYGKLDKYTIFFYDTAVSIINNKTYSDNDDINMYNDWRLPTVEECQKIKQYTPSLFRGWNLDIDWFWCDGNKIYDIGNGDITDRPLQNDVGNVMLVRTLTNNINLDLDI